MTRVLCTTAGMMNLSLLVLCFILDTWIKSLPIFLRCFKYACTDFHHSGLIPLCTKKLQFVLYAANTTNHEEDKFIAEVKTLRFQSG